MSSEVQNAPEQDEASAANDRQFLIWARQLGVTLEELRSAVEHGGPMPDLRDQAKR
ncbi:MAG: hypothetical protein M3544_08310 [Pseudomonadota bacterium]|nr:hypothetical protein [Pseudomonadota bacterium]